MLTRYKWENEGAITHKNKVTNYKNFRTCTKRHDGKHVYRIADAR